MEYSIVKVDKNNFSLFEEMVFYRQNGRERTENERVYVRLSNAVHKTLKDKNLYVFAAQTSQKFIGWISLVYIPKISRTNGFGHLFIDELWVDSGYRKNGIAYALMQKADDVSKELNVMGVRLYVSLNNNEAHSLYEKCGYANKGEAMFMEKEN